MREIQFRGKRISDGELVYGFAVTHDNHAFILTPTNSNGNGTEIDSFPVNPVTVGEFTGLTDNNGARIFEDDIVKTHYANAPKADFVEMIVFRNGRFCATNGVGFTQLYDNTVQPINRGNNIFMDSIEVIGNIHDNPELLRNKK